MCRCVWLNMSVRVCLMCMFVCVFSCVCASVYVCVPSCLCISLHPLNDEEAFEKGVRLQFLHLFL